jgi:hypothetical protein
MRISAKLLAPSADRIYECRETENPEDIENI